MLRTTLCASLALLSACTAPMTQFRPASFAGPVIIASPAARNSTDARLAEHLGRWEGRSFVWGSDTIGTEWTLIQIPTADGGLSGMISWATTGTEPVALRVLRLTPTGFVYEFGPFRTTTLGDVSGRAEGRIEGDRMTGTFELRPVGGGVPVKGRFEGSRTSASLALDTSR